MRPTVFQHAELRDEDDQIVQQGTYGKGSALSNSTNDAWIDYVMNNLEALKRESVSTDSPAFTGIPTAPTPLPDDDSTQIATTEFVQNIKDDEVTRADEKYLPFAGGTVSGDLTVNGDINGNVKGNADTATNATNDKNGNDITETYIPLSGGTVTGDLEVTGDLSVGGTVTGDLTGNADTATNATNATNDGNGNNIANTYQPAVVGAVIAFAGSTNPTGWLLCDGSAVSRMDYAALFNVIGTTYGNGDGSTTFNLPNLTDKFIEGSATSGTVHSAGLPNLVGNVGLSINDCWGDGALFLATDYANGKGASKTYEGYGMSFNASRYNAIYGNSNTVQPPSVTMRYIIKY